MDSWGTKVRYGTTTSESFVHCLYLIAALRADCETSTMSSIRVIGGMLSRGGMVSPRVVAGTLRIF